MKETNYPNRSNSTGLICLQQGDYPGETEIIRKLAGAQFIESHYATEVSMEMHTHSLPFIHVILEGSVTDLSKNSTATSGVAQVTFCPAGEPHATRWHRGGKGFAIEFGTQKAAEWFEWGLLPNRAVELTPGLVSGLLFAARRECFANDLAGVTGAEGYLAEALAELLRLPHPTKMDERPSRRLRQAREILMESYETLPSLTDVARQIGVHPVYLARAFRHSFGETVGDCIRRRRIDAACRLIARSEMSLTEIALEVGFADQSHFTRTFKRHLGVPPVEYARLVRLQRKSANQS